MNCSSRGLRTATRRCWRQSATRQPRQPRRLASHEAGHSHGHGDHGPSSRHLPAGSGNESLGPSFYLILAAVPVLYGVYAFTNTEDNALTRFLKRYQISDAAENAKNAANVALVQKALEDRSLFLYAETDHEIDHRFPERFNVGSPMNNMIGNSRANLTELRDFYAKKYQAAEERRLANVKDGKVVSIYERPDTAEIVARLGQRVN